MPCQVRRSEQGNIVRVEAPNGKESILYNDILKRQPDPEEALRLWAQAYTSSFKSRFGDWEKDPQSAVTSLDENGEPSISAVFPGDPGEELDKKIKNFLAAIGVNVKTVQELRDLAGNPLTAVAKADMLNKIIEVVDGQSDITTLPEEAAHFFVELLGEENPLYQEMFKDITRYDVYGEVLDQYRNTPGYRNADGTINFTKLKKEAIGKLIAQHIISQETGSELPERIAKAQKWWEKVWNFITSVFAQSKNNPFTDSARRIINNDTKGLKKIEDLSSSEVYFQIDNTFSKIKADQQRIHLDNSINPATGEKKHTYTVDGKAVVDKNGDSRSVTSVEVDAWYRSKFPTDNRSIRQKNIDKLKAEEGDKIHADAQAIIERYIDKNTGELITNPVAPTSYHTNKSVHDKLETYISQLLRSYKPGTKFLVENRIYDSKKNMAGSIDLLVLLPDGSADIYDWKSQEIKQGETDLKWFKEPAYRIQLDAYRRILGQEYGITKFNKVRAIPISTKFQYKKDINGYTPKNVADIEIGAFDPRFIPEEQSYLLPVVAQDETSGDAQLDKLIAQLNAIYEKLSQERVDKDKKYLKAEELNKIKRAIRDLQVRQDLSTFVENGLAEVKKYEDKLDSGTITKTDVLESIDILRVYAEAQDLLEGQLRELKKRILREPDDYVKADLEKVQDRFLRMTGNARSVVSRMKRKMEEIGTEIAQEQGISNLLQAERTMDRLKSMFRSLSTLPTRAIQTFYKLLSTAQTKRDDKVRELNTNLAKLKEDMETWARAKGISSVNMFDGILKFDDKGNWTGEFLDKYSKEFYVKRNEAIRAGDIKWLRDNTIFDKEAYEKELESYKKSLETVVYSVDAEVNKNRREAALKKWIELRNAAASDVALTNKGNRFLKPKDTWQSDGWKNLNQPENAPLKAAFDYFQLLKSTSDRLGMVEFDSGFIPSVRQDKLELLVFNGLTTNANSKGLFESLQTDSDKSFGEIDPITGELIKKIPVFFTQDLGEKKADGTIDYSMKSKDLFKVFSIWGVHTHNYEAMQSIRDSAEILVSVERSKKSLVTNFYGKVTRDKKEKTGNDENANVLEDFVKYYIYGQKAGDNSDYAVKVLGKEYSVTKGARSILSFMSIKTLALNPLSGTATFVGGTGNAFFQAAKGHVFNTVDWAKGLRNFTSRNPIAMAWLDLLDVGLEDQQRKRSNNLSVSGAVANMTIDQLFILQRTGDKAVQYPVALTMLETHMIDENGKIVDINKYVKEKNNYNNFYNLSKEEQKTLRAKIDKEVGELKATRALINISKVENDKLVVAGLDPSAQTFIDFKNKIKKVNKTIIGNATHEDINSFRITLLGQAMMQFRSWMPQMMVERFGDMSYDIDLDSYQYGKARVFFKHLVDKKIFPLIGELITGFGSNTINKAKQRYAEFKVRKMEEGEEFNMSEAEFIDMYIGNLRSMIRELSVLAGFIALVLWAKGGDDEDKDGVRKYMARMFEKYQNEFAFYYAPTEFTQMIKSPIPVVGLLMDFEKAVGNTLGQAYGFAAGDEEVMDANRPAKYIGKILPITKEAMQTYAMFDADFKREWDIK